MIERGPQNWEISCDDCSEQEELGDRDNLSFQEAWVEARARGWTATPDPYNGTWAHQCPSCGEDFDD